jgi:imidazoleglycerol-phosphate dehydratase
MARMADIQRTTTETEISLSVHLDGSGQCRVETGVGFLDHMLTHLAKHSLMDLEIRCRGDLHIDAHHTVEDIGICMGKALVVALGDKQGLRRYGSACLPMDDCLVTAAVDLGGRPYLHWQADIPNEQLGAFHSSLAEEFWRAVSSAGLLNLHVILHHGRNAHHMIEAIFKAVSRALCSAMEIDPRRSGIPSTKGTL